MGGVHPNNLIGPKKLAWVVANLVLDLTCKRASVGQNKGLLIPRSSFDSV